jgi:hypothetical protein
MTTDQIFGIANMVALAGWIALAALPRQRWVRDTLCRLLLPGALAVIYSVIVVSAWNDSEGGFGSLTEVATLFSNSWLLLAGWVHYLAFDLFIGTWEVRDAQERGIPHVLVLPCLVLTFLFGPAGLLLYLLVRGLPRTSLQQSRPVAGPA